MPFGYVETKRLPLGLGDLYLNNEFVGTLKGSVNLTVTREYAYQRPGNMIADVKGAAMSEEVMLDAEICDIKLAQVRKALGINEAIDTESVTFRKREQLTLVSSTAKTLAQTAIASSEKVSKLDRSVTYVKGTDYTLPSAGTTITRLSGSIASGQTVLIEYNFSGASASSLKYGGELTAPNTFELVFSHELEDGKILQVRFYKAMADTEFAMAFNERSSGDYSTHPIRFKALVDLTKPEGSNLFEIAEQA